MKARTIMETRADRYIAASDKINLVTQYGPTGEIVNRRAHGAQCAAATRAWKRLVYEWVKVEGRDMDDLPSFVRKIEITG